MAIITIRCKSCGSEFTAEEYLTELWFDDHCERYHERTPTATDVIEWAKLRWPKEWKYMLVHTHEVYETLAIEPDEWVAMLPELMEVAGY